MRHLIGFALLLSAAPAALHAQNSDVGSRVDRLEREVRAMQRQVFPGASGQYFEPEIQPGTQQPQATGNAASAPITDLIDRVNSLERQLATMTGQVEENSYRLRQIESSIEAMQAAASEPGPGEDPGFEESSGGGFGSVERPSSERPASEQPSGRRTTAPREEPASDAEEDGETGAAVSDNLRAMTGGGAEEATEEGAAQAAGEGPFRAEGAEPPLPEDPAEAAYVSGYRLWRDGNYEAARAQLRKAVDDYPGQRFESYARNLLGRAYLDDGKPASATEIFVRNYQDLPNGERAADSLFFLGVALTQLDYKDRACLAFNELQEVYGETLRSDISEQVPDARRAAGCQ